MIIPADRISHTDICPGNLGRRCSCDREQLTAAQGFVVAWATIATIAMLALAAAALR